MYFVQYCNGRGGEVYFNKSPRDIPIFNSGATSFLLWAVHFVKYEKKKTSRKYYIIHTIVYYTFLQYSHEILLYSYLLLLIISIKTFFKMNMQSIRYTCIIVPVLKGSIEATVPALSLQHNE